MTSTNEFFGVTLDEENPCGVFDFRGESTSRCHKIVVKQMMLDPEADPYEENLIEVNSPGDVVHTLLGVLKAGESRTLNPDVSFFEEKLTFNLVAGNGPVHLIGQIYRDNVDIIFMSKHGQCTTKLPKKRQWLF